MVVLEFWVRSSWGLVGACGFEMGCNNGLWSVKWVYDVLFA